MFYIYSNINIIFLYIANNKYKSGVKTNKFKLINLKINIPRYQLKKFCDDN